ncbi:MAG: hypothetical protein ACOCWO_05345 [Candidatus Muiribacteriaceae bacterium]
MKRRIIYVVFILLVSGILLVSAEDKDIFESMEINKRLQEQELLEKEKDPAYHISEAEKNYADGEYNDAAQSYQRAFELDPGTPSLKISYFKSLIMAYIKDYQAIFYILIFLAFSAVVLKTASAWSKGASKRIENNKSKELNNIKELYISGKYDEVIKQATAIQKKTYSFTVPDKFMLNSNLAKAYYKKGVYNKAKQYAIEALRLKSIAPDLHDILCEIFLKLKDTSPRAIKEYEFRLKKKPNDNNIINLLFDYYYSKKDLNDNAVNIYLKVYKYNPEKIEAADMLCLRGMRKKDTSKDMIPIYEKIHKEVRPDDIKLKQILLKSYFIHNMFEKALPLVKELVGMKQFIENKDIHNILYKVYKGLNRTDELNSLYKELKDKFPESVILQEIFEEQGVKQEGHKIEKDVSKVKDIASDGIKICPICAHINIKDAKFCEKCGKPLNS